MLFTELIEETPAPSSATTKDAKRAATAATTTTTTSSSSSTSSSTSTSTSTKSKSKTRKSNKNAKSSTCIDKADAALTADDPILAPQIVGHRNLLTPECFGDDAAADANAKTSCDAAADTAEGAPTLSADDEDMAVLTPERLRGGNSNKSDEDKASKESNSKSKAEGKASDKVSSKKEGVEYYVGLMSGTSIDGLDAALIGIIPGKKGFENVATVSIDWDSDLKALLHQLCVKESAHDRIEDLYAAGNGIAATSAKLVKQVIAGAGLTASDITAIGSHGQTVRHCPQQHFSVQIDNGPQLANTTGIDAVVNFRAADLALGGQGAPLTQAFHQQIFASNDRVRLVLNLGGIANLTVLAPKGKLITAFDTGPANTLMDYVCRSYLQCGYDEKGKHARIGHIDHEALSKLLTHPYLQRDLPKSTGREDFNADTIAFMLGDLPDLALLRSPEEEQRLCDILATLTEYTAITVADAIAKVATKFATQLGCNGSKQQPQLPLLSQQPQQPQLSADLIVCGGGALNVFLCERLLALAKERGLDLELKSCCEFGVDPKFLEAQAFAYFAYCCIHAKTLNLGSTTGATSPSILGMLCPAPHGAYTQRTTAFYTKA